LFGAYDKESQRLVKGIQTSKIDVSPIHHQKRAGLGGNDIEQMNVVDFGVSNVDKNGKMELWTSINV